MSDVKVISYLTAEGSIVDTEPMVFKRLYAVGQPLVIKSVAYKVTRVEVNESVQVVNMEPITICNRCGGIEGRLEKPYECICVRFAGRQS